MVPPFVENENQPQETGIVGLTIQVVAQERLRVIVIDKLVRKETPVRQIFPDEVALFDPVGNGNGKASFLSMDDSGGQEI